MLWLQWNNGFFHIQIYFFEGHIGQYLDNFVTNPYTFSTFSGDSDSKSPEYAKKP